MYWVEKQYSRICEEQSCGLCNAMCLKSQSSSPGMEVKNNQSRKERYHWKQISPRCKYSLLRPAFITLGYHSIGFVKIGKNDFLVSARQVFIRFPPVISFSASASPPHRSDSPSSKKTTSLHNEIRPCSKNFETSQILEKLRSVQ